MYIQYSFPLGIRESVSACVSLQRQLLKECQGASCMAYNLLKQLTFSIVRGAVQSQFKGQSYLDSVDAQIHFFLN